MQDTLVRRPIQFDSPAWAEVNPLQLLKKSLDDLDTQSRQLKKAATAGLIKVHRRLIRRQAKLEILPSEILIEIFKYLGWRGILISRGVSMRLFEISKSRPIWLLLLRQCSMMLPRSPKLDRPVELYTTQELEDLVVSRIAAEVAWRSGKDPQYREITLPKGFGDSDSVLVDGGRWFLVLSQLRVHYGCVLAYDLDAPVIQEPEVVIRPQDTWDAQRLYFMAVDVDEKEPTLTFNVSIIPESYRGPGDVITTLLGETEDVPIPILQVYRVTQVGHGAQAKLVSTRLKSFPLPAHGDMSGVSLCGPHFARILRPRMEPRDGKPMIEVYDWTKCEASTLVKASILHPDESASAVLVLPDSKLLAFYRHHMSVYTIQTIPETEDNHPATSTPDFTTAFESESQRVLRPAISKPHIYGGMIRVAIALQQGIYGLIIPRNGDPPRVTVITNDEIYGMRACLGINRFCSPGGWSTASYTWPEDNAIGLDGELRQPLPLQEREKKYARYFQFPALMDEDSGRVVNGFKGGFAVFDWR